MNVKKYVHLDLSLSAHSHLDIGSSERDAWLLCMEKALQKQPYEQDFKEYLLKQLSIPDDRCRNQDSLILN
ncbi:MAG: hypothetical protein V7785_18135 [Bermanella sp.]